MFCSCCSAAFPFVFCSHLHVIHLYILVFSSQRQLKVTVMNNETRLTRLTHMYRRGHASRSCGLTVGWRVGIWCWHNGKRQERISMSQLATRRFAWKEVGKDRKRWPGSSRLIGLMNHDQGI
ncbi:hypothetical protein FIBSPDRAFT_456825 [Athelia psychrophila]|uniref:Secreted protein n=1 Tax=Athelia psychrophila TaxID=1759441 RepID=A0A166LY11_9AGAM|nr:hypothetical protein FIBSPDRAFT_456825 [Fibularhizoctonia sp. CBS 109695]